MAQSTELASPKSMSLSCKRDFPEVVILTVKLPVHMFISRTTIEITL